MASSAATPVAVCCAGLGDTGHTRGFPWVPSQHCDTPQRDSPTLQQSQLISALEISTLSTQGEHSPGVWSLLTQAEGGMTLRRDRAAASAQRRGNSCASGGDCPQGGSPSYSRCPETPPAVFFFFFSQWCEVPTLPSMGRAREQLLWAFLFLIQECHLHPAVCLWKPAGPRVPDAPAANPWQSLLGQESPESTQGSPWAPPPHPGGSGSKLPCTHPVGTGSCTSVYSSIKLQTITALLCTFWFSGVFAVGFLKSHLVMGKCNAVYDLERGSECPERAGKAAVPGGGGGLLRLIPKKIKF